MKTKTIKIYARPSPWSIIGRAAKRSR
jgi:hypothetical protein